VTEFKDPKEIYREALTRVQPAVETQPPKIQRAEVWPYPELDRLWVRVETGGFATFPNLSFTLIGPDGDMVSTMFMVEIRNPYQSLTMHLRRPPLPDQTYRLEIVLDRDETTLDTRVIEFPLTYRDPAAGAPQQAKPKEE
jgi:hypothetical protein